MKENLIVFFLTCASFDVQQEIDYVVKVKMCKSLKNIDGNMKVEGYKSGVVDNKFELYYFYPPFGFLGLGV